MACTSCGSPTPCGCDPCAPALITTESLTSEITNLITTLLGTFTKTIVNGRAVWSAVCSPNSSGLSCFPLNAGEGLICYFLRILTQIGLFSPSLWNIGNSYCKNTLVASGASLYVSIQDVPAGIAITNAAYWMLLITAPAGPQGPPGASGAGSATNYATQVATGNVTLTNTGAVVFCEPAGPMTVNLPAIASVDTGKWYKIWTNGAFNVTIDPNGAETINGAATFALNTVNEAIEIVAKPGSTDWRIF